MTTPEPPPPSPRVIDVGLQHERTALAWERTAISMMVAGILLARYAAADAHFTLGLLGLIHTAIGGGILVWAGNNYEGLHGPVGADTEVVHPTLARLVGITTVVSTGLALVLAVILTAEG